MRASKRSAARATALYEVREGLVERRPLPDALLAIEGLSLRGPPPGG